MARALKSRSIEIIAGQRAEDAMWGITESPEFSSVQRLRNFFHLFAVITLWVATVLAFLGEWKQPGQGMAKIGYAIIAVIVVSGLFSFGQEYRIERTANPRGTSQAFAARG